MDDKNLIMETLPRILGQTREEIAQVVEAFKEWIRQDQSCLVEIIGMMSEIPLSDVQKKTVTKSILNSLSMVSESDLPVVFRTLLKNMTKSTGADIAEAIQEQCRFLGENVVLLLIEVFSTTFSVNSLACDVFLKLLKSTKEFSKYDVVILLLLMHGKYKKDVFEIFTNAALRDSLSKNFCAIIEPKNVIQYFSSPLYSICLQVLKNDTFFGCKFVSNMFISILQFYDSIRLNLVNILITSLTISRVGGEILVELSNHSKCAPLLSRYSALMEDFLHNTHSLSDDNIKNLAVSMCRCAKHSIGICETLMIFIRKALFSGQGFDTKVGIFMASFVINTEIFPPLDSERILTWIYEMFDQHAVTSRNLHILQLLDFNIGDKSAMFLSKIQNLIKKLNLVRGKLWSFQYLEDLAVPDEIRSSFLFYLISCSAKYEMRVVKKNDPFIEIASRGFNQTSANVLNVYSVSSAILSLFEPRFLSSSMVNRIPDLVATNISTQEACIYEIPVPVLSFCLATRDNWQENSSTVLINPMDLEIRIATTLLNQIEREYPKEKSNIERIDSFEKNLALIKKSGLLEKILKIHKKKDESAQVLSLLYQILSICILFSNEYSRFGELKSLFGSQKEVNNWNGEFMKSISSSLSLELRISLYSLLYSLNFVHRQNKLLAQVALGFMTGICDNSSSKRLIPFVLRREVFSHSLLSQASLESRLMILPWFHLSPEKARLEIYDLIQCLYEYGQKQNLNTRGEHVKYRILSDDTVYEFVDAILFMITLYFKLMTVDYIDNRITLTEPMNMCILFLKVLYTTRLIKFSTVKGLQGILKPIGSRLDDAIELKSSKNLRVQQLQPLFELYSKLLKNLIGFAELVRKDPSFVPHSSANHTKRGLLNLFISSCQANISLTKMMKSDSVVLPICTDTIDKYAHSSTIFKIEDKDEPKITFFKFLTEKDTNYHSSDESNEESDTSDEIGNDFMIKPAKKKSRDDNQ